jgi:Nitrile hydratase, alpha chain
MVKLIRLITAEWEAIMADQAARGETTAFGRAVMRAWSDPAFKVQLLADPRAALAAVGASVLPGVTVKIVENTDTVMHLVLPAKPAGAELSEEALQKVVAGNACVMSYPPSSGCKSHSNILKP